MIKFEPRFNKCTSYPPGTTHVYLPHPYYMHRESIMLALFNDHRFAFFYWALWHKKNKQNRSDLVTMDWHQDLAPVDTKEELKKLDLENTFELSFFAWARLNSLNDDHIKSAMYCNIIGDAYVICKQGMHIDQADEVIDDMFGNKHIIKKFNNTQDAYEYLKDASVERVYFDIDLDYFTIENQSTNCVKKVTYIRESEMSEIINPNSDFMYWIFQRMKGFTIALEPDFVGGFTKAMRLYRIIERSLFTGSVLRNETTWRHF